MVSQLSKNCLALISRLLRRTLPLLLPSLSLLAGASPLLAATADPATAKLYDTITVYWENDFFAGTDRDYTNGLRFTWSTPYRVDPDDPMLPGWSRPWLKKLPSGDPHGRAVSLSFGQSIYTPSDTSRDEIDPTDRPYAGYSYLAADFHNRSPEVKTSWEFQVGVVGPLSFAEEFQDFTHDLLGNGRAKGWEHQLKDEPIFEVICERHWLLLHTEKEHGLAFDLIPHVGGQLGNASTLLNVGGELRVGWDLPQNFGTCPIRGGCESNSAFAENPPRPGLSGVYLFLATDGRWVLRNIFLDGNTFADSASVERVPLVADFMAGIALQYGVTRMTYSYVLRTKEFESQTDRQLFGALSCSWTY
jgi:hypothetical protein